MEPKFGHYHVYIHLFNVNITVNRKTEVWPRLDTATVGADVFFHKT